MHRKRGVRGTMEWEKRGGGAEGEGRKGRKGTQEFDESKIKKVSMKQKKRRVRKSFYFVSEYFFLTNKRNQIIILIDFSMIQVKFYNHISTKIIILWFVQVKKFFQFFMEYFFNERVDGSIGHCLLHTYPLFGTVVNVYPWGHDSVGLPYFLIHLHFDLFFFLVQVL